MSATDEDEASADARSALMSLLLWAEGSGATGAIGSMRCGREQRALLVVGRRSERRALELADDLGPRRLDERSRSALGQLARR
jgi:hypothetical protein